MSSFAHIPAALVEFVVGFVTPMLMRGPEAEPRAARAMALRLLADYNPRTGRELRLAGEAILFGLEGLAVLGSSGINASNQEERFGAAKWACSLARMGHQAQKRLDALRQDPPVREPSAEDAGAAPEAAGMPPEPVAADAAPPPGNAGAPEDGGGSRPTATGTAGLPGIADAEAKLKSAEKLLNLMKAYHKGAPPPHSEAAQDIAAQQRVVDLARMTLAQARRRAQSAADAPAGA